MPRISQLISIVSGVKTDTTVQTAELVARVAQEELVTGRLVTYRARFEEADQSVQARELAALVGSEASVKPADEAVRVRATAEGTLHAMEQLLTRLYDVTRTLDQANAEARADVKVGTHVLWAKVPTSHLLWLERELADLHDKVSQFPTLDQADSWNSDGTDEGISKTAPVEVARTKKVPFNHIKFAGDQYHEPQIELLSRDETVGWKQTIRFSGALDPKRKRQLLDRLTLVREAVKFAREEANATEVPDVHEAKRFFDWWLRN